MDKKPENFIDLSIDQTLVISLRMTGPQILENGDHDHSHRMSPGLHQGFKLGNCSICHKSVNKFQDLKGHIQGLFISCSPVVLRKGNNSKSFDKEIPTASDRGSFPGHLEPSTAILVDYMIFQEPVT